MPKKEARADDFNPLTVGILDDAKALYADWSGGGGVTDLTKRRVIYCLNGPVQDLPEVALPLRAAWNTSTASRPGWAHTS